MSDDPKVSPDEIGVTLPFEGPFSFGLGLSGELVIGCCQSNSFVPVRAFLKIPGEYIPLLRRLLEEGKNAQETLAAIPPTRSKH